MNTICPGTTITISGIVGNSSHKASSNCWRAVSGPSFRSVQIVPTAKRGRSEYLQIAHQEIRAFTPQFPPSALFGLKRNRRSRPNHRRRQNGQHPSFVSSIRTLPHLGQQISLYDGLLPHVMRRAPSVAPRTWRRQWRSNRLPSLVLPFQRES